MTMGIEIKDSADDVLNKVKDALQPYVDRHNQVEVVIRRQGRYAIRVRIINPAFAGLSRSERHEAIWAYLESLPESILSDVSLLLLLTPEEAAQPLADFAFDDTVANRL
jgi:stress-induced morphogen